MKNTAKGIISGCIAAAVLAVAGCGQTNTPAPEAAVQTDGDA